MKSCKRWTTSGAAVCALCRESFPASTNGVLCDFTAPVENVTIVKFLCMGCAGPITTAVAGEEIIRRSQSERDVHAQDRRTPEERAGQDFMIDQMRDASRRGRS